MYVGPKGYTIPKNLLSEAKINEIKKELTIHPFAPNATVKPKPYCVYRENPNKLYVPYYYGIKHIDATITNKTLQEPTKINVPFEGTLYEKQQQIVDIYINHVNTVAPIKGGLLELPTAYGKTVLGLNICSRLGLKTIIIVNKDFLADQWIERAQQFIPSAKIGRIQGKIIDIDGKDIVIAMLQSASMKEYNPEVFSSFGLMIVDEVHHIGSEVFSNSLHKIVTPYTLGLSATMERKDKTTNVINMFLGDIIFKGKRDEVRDVTVKQLNYYVDDPKFNEPISNNQTGKVAYSSMISKLCDYSMRTEFILSEIKKTIETYPSQQIMVLAHNKSILNYMYNAITHRKLATVGYYLGGMKKDQLKETEGKQIVLATYAMAAEALDIKTLSILVLATPKTDVVQAVGRILRLYHSNAMVLDVVDSHDIFQNQWKKRKTFYRKEKYTISCSKEEDEAEDADLNEICFL